MGSDTTPDSVKNSGANDRGEEKSESEDEYKISKNSDHHDGECSIVVSAALGDDSVDSDNLAEVAAVAAAPAACMTAEFSTCAVRVDEMSDYNWTNECSVEGSRLQPCTTIRRKPYNIMKSTRRRSGRMQINTYEESVVYPGSQTFGKQNTEIRFQDSEVPLSTWRESTQRGWHKCSIPYKSTFELYTARSRPI